MQRVAADRAHRRARVAGLRRAVPRLPSAAHPLPRSGDAPSGAGGGSVERHHARRLEPGRQLQRPLQSVDLDFRDRLPQGAEGLAAPGRRGGRPRRRARGQRRWRARAAGRPARVARVAGRGARRVVGGAPRRRRSHLFPWHRLPRNRTDRRLSGRYGEDAHVPRAAPAEGLVGGPTGGLVMSNARVVHLDTHQAVQTLLPWYVTQRLDAAELRRVEAHLADCPRCQAELAFERRLQAAHAGLEVDGDAERGLAKLHAQLAADSPSSTPRLPLAQRLLAGWRAAAPWLRWALAAQFAAIALLGVLRPPAPLDSYRALGVPASASAANVVVMFGPDATERDLRQALKDSGARLVGGPTVTGAYLLELPPQRREAGLLRLRAQPSVVLAESLDTGALP